MGKKKKDKSKSESKESGFESSDSDSGEVSEKTKMDVLPIAAKKPIMPGATSKARRQPPWYNVRILEEERPDLLGANGKLNLELALCVKKEMRSHSEAYHMIKITPEKPEETLHDCIPMRAMYVSKRPIESKAQSEGAVQCDFKRSSLENEDAALMDMFIRDKSDLQTGDLIITDDNLNEEDRHFNRYEVQLKYNEGRYTALYLISRQICANNEVEEKNVLYAMKTSIRPNSANIVLRMKRELRILNELKKSKCPYSPVALDSGRVADLPFIVMNLLDRNLEKLREQVAVLRPTTVFYIAMEIMSALAFLHSHKYIHRDVKLSNICIGAGPASTKVFLIDYGDTVKKGKKIKYGTPDAYTLPFWSLDAHKRTSARERGDAESWFYVVAELVKPGCLPWIKMNNENDVQAAKQLIWTEGGQNLTDNVHLHLLQELIRAPGDSFDHETAKMIVRSAIDSVHSGPFSLEWAPNARINLPHAPQTSITSLKTRVETIKKGIMKTGSEKGARPQDNDAAKRPVEVTPKTMQPKGDNVENVTQYSTRRRRKAPSKSQEQTGGRMVQPQENVEKKIVDEMVTARVSRKLDTSLRRKESIRKLKKPLASKTLPPFVRKAASKRNKPLAQNTRKVPSKNMQSKMTPPSYQRRAPIAQRGSVERGKSPSKNKRK